MKVEVRKLRRRIFEEAINTQSSPQAVAAAAFSEVPNVVLANMPSLNSIQRSIRRVRQNDVAAPALPQNLQELIISPEFVTDKDGQNFLAHDTGKKPNRILIFCTKQSLN